jgi:hypothetical protein
MLSQIIGLGGVPQPPDVHIAPYIAPYFIIAAEAAHYSAPLHFRFANYMQPISQFWDVCTYGKMIRFMTCFDITEI